jgi:hypothetical protein
LFPQVGGEDTSGRSVRVAVRKKKASKRMGCASYSRLTGRRVKERARKGREREDWMVGVFVKRRQKDGDGATGVERVSVGVTAGRLALNIGWLHASTPSRRRVDGSAAPGTNGKAIRGPRRARDVSSGCGQRRWRGPLGRKRSTTAVPLADLLPDGCGVEVRGRDSRPKICTATDVVPIERAKQRRARGETCQGGFGSCRSGSGENGEQMGVEDQ